MTQKQWVYKETSAFDYGRSAWWIPDVCAHIKTEATARLIAAAPDLLEALKAWQAYMDICSGCDDDSDEGFLAMLHSHSKASSLTSKAITKAERGNQ